MSSGFRYAISMDYTFYRLSDQMGVLLGDDERHIVHGEEYIDVLSCVAAGLDINCLMEKKSLHYSAKIFFILENVMASGFILLIDEPMTAVTQSPCSPPPTEHSCNCILWYGSASRFERFDVPDELSKSFDEIGCICIIADTYLDPDLCKIIGNQKKHKLVCLIKILGKTLWIGPLAPPADDIWKKVLSRISDNFPVEQHVACRISGAPVGARRVIRKNHDLGKFLLQELQRSSASTETPISPMPHVVSFNYETGERTVHRLFTRINSFRKDGPLDIAATDGGRRSCSAEDLIATTAAVVDPIMGLIPTLTDVGGIPGANVTTATQVFPNFYLLKENRKLGLRMAAAGKGETRAQARASCIGEAIERYSACFQGNESRIKKTLIDLGETAIDPRTLMLFSEKQYLNRGWWNTHHGFFHYVPEPFNNAELLSWVQCERVCSGEKKWVPASYVYFNYADIVLGEPRTCVADSNGCAAGNSIVEAQIQALYELIERDACAIWWYNKLRMPELDPHHIRSIFVQGAPLRYRSYGRTLSLLDITSDLEIPVVLAVSCKPDGTSICVGLGCHLDRNIAASRAVAELDQFVAMFGLGVLNQFQKSGNRELDSWLRNESIDDHIQFLPWPLSSARPLESTLPKSIEDELNAVVNILEIAVGPVYYVDLSREEAPLNAVRALVPGLRHFWARFAPGRLFDVPLETNRLSHKLHESELNSIPFFL